ncbi:MAG: hypothetical protein ACRDJE_26705 [Dehalococcoidia bacterium]
MTMRGLQNVVCRGAIDTEYFRWLARSPAEALYGYDLADDEVAMIVALGPQSLDELAGSVEAWRRGDVLPARMPARAWEAPVAALAG